MERGEFPIGDKELAAKIGPVTFSKPDFGKDWAAQFGWIIKTKDNVQIIVYQTPWNCGQLTMCGLGATPEVIKIQDFLAINMAEVNGYKVLTASSYPHVSDTWLKQDLGWRDCGEYIGRYSDKQKYIIKQASDKNGTGPFDKHANGFKSIHQK